MIIEISELMNEEWVKEIMSLILKIRTRHYQHLSVSEKKNCEYISADLSIMITSN